MKSRKVLGRKIYLLVALLTLLLFDAPPALAQELPSNPLSNLDKYIKINKMEKKLSKQEVDRNETFYATVGASATVKKDINISLTAKTKYEVLARGGDPRREFTLGTGEKQAGPYAGLKAGTTLDLAAHIPLIFPEEAQPGKYTVLVRPASIEPVWLYIVLKALVGVDPVLLGIVTYSGEVAPTPTPKPTPPPGQEKGLDIESVMSEAEALPTQELLLDPDGDGLYTLVEIVLGFDPNKGESQSDALNDRDFWLSKLASDSQEPSKYGDQKPLGPEERSLIATHATAGVLQETSQALLDSELSGTSRGQEIIEGISKKIAALRHQAGEEEFQVMTTLARDWFEATP